MAAKPPKTAPPKRKTDSVASKIGRDIAAHRLKAGALLPSDAALCATHQISRVVLREALRLLGAKGLVQARPKAGTFVNPRHAWALFDADVLAWIELETPAEKRRTLLHQLLDLRLMIEPGSAALAASRAEPAQRQTISDAFNHLRHASTGAPMADTERDFFAHLHAAAHNDFIAPLDNICALTHRLINQLGHRYIRDFNTGLHEKLTRAILNHDAPTSRATTQAILIDMYMAESV